MSQEEAKDYAALYFVLICCCHCMDSFNLLFVDQFDRTDTAANSYQPCLFRNDHSGLGQLHWRFSLLYLDYLSITSFAKKGNAATAVAGIFSGQLFNFLFGFGISLVFQSLDGEYKF
jgi:hypothetical protein